jgi:hypothetical protein
MSSALEIAFDMISANSELKIVGIYESVTGHVTLPSEEEEDSSRTPKKLITPLAATIYETIRNQFKDALVLSFRNPDSLRHFEDRYTGKPEVSAVVVQNGSQKEV